MEEEEEAEEVVPVKKREMEGGKEGDEGRGTVLVHQTQRIVQRIAQQIAQRIAQRTGCPMSVRGYPM